MRIQILSVIAIGVLAAACGETRNERMLTAGLGGAAVGALFGPIGAIVGAGVGTAGGAALNEPLDNKINQWASAATDGGPTVAADQPTTTTQMSGAAQRRGAMSTDEIHDRLHAAGYDRVYRIRRQGDVYVARGERDNRVYALEADAMTGRILASDEVGRREPGSGAQTRTAPTTAATGPVQSEQQIRDRLQQAGYDQVSSVRREGDAYRAQAQWANRSYDVRLDAQTGRIMSSTPVRSQSGSGAGQSGQMGTGAAGAGAGGMDEAQVRTALLNEGYSQISNLRREGDVYAARAVRNTQTFNLRVDAQNGRIVQATPVTGQGGG